MQGLNIDIQKTRDVATFVSTEASKYDSNLSDLYAKFNQLSSFWQGADYDAAKAIMDQNNQPLLDLGTSLHQIATALNSVSDEYERKIRASAAQFE